MIESTCQDEVRCPVCNNLFTVDAAFRVALTLRAGSVVLPQEHMPAPVPENPLRNLSRARWLEKFRGATNFEQLCLGVLLYILVQRLVFKRPDANQRELEDLYEVAAAKGKLATFARVYGEIELDIENDDWQWRLDVRQPGDPPRKEPQHDQ